MARNIGDVVFRLDDSSLFVLNHPEPVRQKVLKPDDSNLFALNHLESVRIHALYFMLAGFFMLIEGCFMHAGYAPCCGFYAC